MESIALVLYTWQRLRQAGRPRKIKAWGAVDDPNESCPPTTGKMKENLRMLATLTIKWLPLACTVHKRLDLTRDFIVFFVQFQQNPVQMEYN